MKHLYEYFSYNNMSELKENILKGDEKTRPLLNLYEKLQEPISLDDFNIRSTGSWGAMFAEHHNLPEKGQLLLLKFNTKNNLLGYKTFSENAREKTLYKYLLSNDTVQFGTVINSDVMSKSEYSDKILNLADTLEVAGINLLDGIYFAQEEVAYYTVREGMDTAYDLPITALETMGESKSKTRNVNLGLNRVEKNLMNSKDFSSFTHLYCKQEMMGLNIVNDEEKIKNLLKLDNQAHEKEFFGAITYDGDYKVTNYSIEAIGGVNSSIAEPRSVTPYLSDNDTKGIILYHNHPSGITTPSQADISATERFKLVAGLLDKELYDHYVVTTSETLSIAEYEQNELLSDKNNIKKNIQKSKEHFMEER